MNWGRANWKLLFISWMQSKRSFTSVTEIHATSYCLVLFCFPWWPSTPPSPHQVLLELPVLLLQGPALPLLEEMVNKVVGNKEAVIGPVQVRGKVAVFCFKSNICKPNTALFCSYKVEDEKLELWLHPAPWPELQSALQHKEFFLFLCSGAWNSIICELGLEDIKHP